jgi:CheY-like chemotaxis protein
MDILIIDDHKSLHMLLTTFLEDIGYTAVSANHGQEALTYLRHTPKLPDVILLDVAMPIMTGWDFLREQQRDIRLARIPVIMMTALGHFDHADAPAGAIAYLDKPIDLIALEKLIRTYAKPRLLVRAVGL